MSLPAPIDPLLQVGLLDADGGVVAVAGQHDRGGGEGGEEALVERSDDAIEVAAGEAGCSWAAGKEGVAAEEDRRSLQTEAHRPAGMPWGGDGAQPQPPDLDDAVVL